MADEIGVAGRHRFDSLIDEEWREFFGMQMNKLQRVNLEVVLRSTVPIESIGIPGDEHRRRYIAQRKVQTFLDRERLMQIISQCVKTDARRREIDLKSSTPTSKA